MTTATPALRTGKVIRMQLINKQTFVWMPLLILASSFAITMMVYGVIAYSVSDRTEPMYGGGSQAPLWYFLVVGVQALSFTFPFAQALSISRREFFFGTYATAILTSLTLTAAFLAGGGIERATDGWGFDAYFFYLPWIWEQGPVVALALYFTIAMFAFTVGFWAATLYKRFNLIGLLSTGVGIAVVIVLTALALSWAGEWPAFGRWIVDLAPIDVAGLFLAVDAVLAGVSYLTIRRAIP
ncbi:hypothetical protein nbrc107696_14660 [Gordonia spumicola]|uniref:Uncharacterized protein n=1 Tax=Gordonia spumicola TaxID=589161 RepID=A0A7I9V7G3_9ACTN|nr:hypothetical protein [Gordonia spumicola]GEE01020.1 hypothetical protein nbrc107696_14660 [Gordonia spumicola]